MRERYTNGARDPLEAAAAETAGSCRPGTPAGTRTCPPSSRRCSIVPPGLPFPRGL